MYQLQRHPDDKITLRNGSTTWPVATLADEYGGRAQITVDDGCYVLSLRQEDERYKYTPYWFDEAAKVMSQLPSPPNHGRLMQLLKLIGI